jgi:hypothetical protein
MFRPPIVVIFREVFFEENVKSVYKYKMLGFSLKAENLC